MVMIYDRIENTGSLGRALQYIKDCHVTHELGGSYTLTFLTDAELNFWQMVKADTPDGLQPFYVANVQKKGDFFDVTCEHVTHLLSNVHIDPISIDGVTLEALVGRLSDRVKNNPLGLPFTLSATTADSPRRFFETEGGSVFDVLHGDDASIKNTWPVKIYRDNFTITIAPRQGRATEVLIAERKNLLSHTAGRNIKDLATRLFLRCEVQRERAEAEDVGEDVETLTATVDSPLINEYPFVIEKAIAVNNENVKSPAELIAYGKKLFDQGLDKPKETLELQPITADMRGLRLGDSAIVYYRKENTYSRTDFVAYEWDVLNKSYINMTFGELPPTLERVVAKKVKKTMRPTIDRVNSTLEGTRFNKQRINAEKQATRKKFNGVQQSLDNQKKEWHSAIADVRETANNTKEELKTLIRQTAEEIKLEASRRYATTSEVASLSVKADRIESQVEAVESTADSAWAKASRVEQTASEIRATVSEVRNTANAAYNKASQFQQTVDDFRFKLGTVDRLSQIFGIYGYGVSVNGSLVVHGDIDCGGGVSALAFREKGAGEFGTEGSVS